MTVRTYDPAKFIIVLGAHVVSGFADGQFIGLERNSDLFTKVIGAGGDVARAKSNDRSARMTLTLMNTSPSNDFLSAQHLADEIDNSGKFPVSILEVGGTTVVQASEGWVVKAPPINRSKSIDNCVWLIDLAQANIVNGSIPADS